MKFEIIKEDRSIKIINEGGDYIDLDFPNDESWRQIEDFLVQSEEELTEEEKQKLVKAIEEVKKGKIISFEELMRRIQGRK